MSVQISAMRAEHIDGAVALQRLCFPEPFPEELLWHREHIQRHLELFPDGQFVAVDGVTVIASASATRIAETNWQSHSNWDTTVGGPFLESFDIEGSTLYGLDISVHPQFRGIGIGRRLYEERFNLATQSTFARYGTACRLPGFQLFAETNEGTSVEQYAKAVVDGQLVDRTLSPLLRYGLTYLGLIHDYMEDEESHNAAALLEWRP